MITNLGQAASNGSALALNVKQAQLNEAARLPIQKIAQIECLYDRLLTSALRANPPPPDG